MHFSILLKTIIAAVLGRTGMARRSLMRVAKGKTGILMYHRVLSPGQQYAGIEPGMFVDHRTFSRHVAFLKQHCRIVPLSGILDAKKSGCEGRTKPVCSLTFDDGWADFIEHAFPVLQAHQVPATVFLPTDFIGTHKWFWTDRLAILLHGQRPAQGMEQAISQARNPLVKRILGCTGSPVARLDKVIGMLKPSPAEQIEAILLEMASVLQVDPSPPGRAFMNWDEIRALYASGLITFGSHTAGHAILTTIGQAEVKRQVQASRSRLLEEKVVDRDCIPFCYPNGNYNRGIADAVREAGYSLAVTTKYGWNGAEGDQFALKRIPIHNDMTATRDMFACRLAGIF